MKKLLFFSFLLISFVSVSFAQWKPAGDRIKTKWADEINIAEVLPEYPRPIMVRDDWKNLNGLWDYAITKVGKPGIPTSFDGQILVPFAVESSLSGVGKTVGAKRELWYRLQQ